LGIRQFNYNAASDAFTPEGSGANCGATCHTIVAERITSSRPTRSGDRPAIAPPARRAILAAIFFDTLKQPAPYPSRRIVMRSFKALQWIMVSALTAAGATCAGAEDQPLGVRLVDQMNALYGAHPVFAPTTPRAPCSKACSRRRKAGMRSARLSFSKAAPTPLVIRFPIRAACRRARHPSVDDGVRGMAIKFRLADGSEADMVCISANGFPVATGEDFLALLQAAGASGPDVPKPTPVEKFLSTHPPHSLSSRRRGLWRSATARNRSSVSMPSIHQCAGTSKFGRYRIVPEKRPGLCERRGGQDASAECACGQSTGIARQRTGQVPPPGPGRDADDVTTDATKVWPDSRPTVEFGEITVIKALDTKKVGHRGVDCRLVRLVGKEQQLVLDFFVFQRLDDRDLAELHRRPVCRPDLVASVVTSSASATWTRRRNLTGPLFERCP